MTVDQTQAAEHSDEGAGGAVAEAPVAVTNLERSYGAVRAVDRLSFRVEAGEVYGLLGPNGAGKTTTLRMLATLLRPDGGEARVAGADIRTEPLTVRRRIGYLTGDTGLYVRLTPPELLRYFGRLHGMEESALDERVTALSEQLDLASFADRRCGSLSTGQQQRVSIARAVLHDPPVLVLDEPTAGLDILAAQSLLDFLRAERKRGKAVLFSTHVMAEAELLCDRVGFLHQGALVAEGTVPALKEQFGGATLAEAFLAAVARDDDDGSADGSESREEGAA